MSRHGVACHGHDQALSRAGHGYGRGWGTNRSAGAGRTASLLVIGDSLTASGEHTQVLLDIAANYTAPRLELSLVGTRGQSLSNRHEGRGGWTVHDYATSGRMGLFLVVSGVATLLYTEIAWCFALELLVLKAPAEPLKLAGASLIVLGAAVYAALS